jgi:hypothetical protein
VGDPEQRAHDLVDQRRTAVEQRFESLRFEAVDQRFAVRLEACLTRRAVDECACTGKFTRFHDVNALGRVAATAPDFQPALGEQEQALILGTFFDQRLAVGQCLGLHQPGQRLEVRRVELFAEEGVLELACIDRVHDAYSTCGDSGRLDRHQLFGTSSA